ncbi:unnamed protein product [Callosobruchus maculatus]|uniref:NADP-dependent oxidoreductase domain-containing protein n=1 Tax=Callosobruchus maculatus TaxID=64391 RepID=A0A653BY19_CALMS|nr:unnamed protein product [Callosobruchus maculatus]
MPLAPKIKFNNGQEFPIFGLGTWKSKPGEVTQAVMDAIDVGYRHFDCAHVYGNEKEVGEALKKKMEEGVVTRDDLYITSKLWNTYHKPDMVEPALKTTLQNLGLKYLDLYLIHWPFALKIEVHPYLNQQKLIDFCKSKNITITAYSPLGSPDRPWAKPGDPQLLEDPKIKSIAESDVDYLDTWKIMEDICRKGLAKSIGVSNFNKRQITRLLENAKIKPVVNQVECHPYLNQKKLTAFCKSKGIEIVGYSPLSTPDREWAKPTDPVLTEEPIIKEIAAKYGKTPAQVVYRYIIQLGVITIPKSVTKSRIEENIKIFDFELTPEEMTKMDTLNCNARAHQLTYAKGHPHFPFDDEY